jgi:hypothetical protein
LVIIEHKWFLRKLSIFINKCKIAQLDVGGTLSAPALVEDGPIGIARGRLCRLVPRKSGRFMRKPRLGLANVTLPLGERLLGKTAGKPEMGGTVATTISLLVGIEAIVMVQDSL